jgi:hypothetical protein
VHVTRHGDGKYTYGSKTIHAQIVDDHQNQKKLVIRMNGGWTVIEDFLKRYAEEESKAQPDTMLKPQSSVVGKSTVGRRSPGRASPTSKRHGSPNQPSWARQ